MRIIDEQGRPQPCTTPYEVLSKAIPSKDQRTAITETAAASAAASLW